MFSYQRRSVDYLFSNTDHSSRFQFHRVPHILKRITMLCLILSFFFPQVLYNAKVRTKEEKGAADTIDRDGRTPLHIAALNGHKDVSNTFPP